MLGIPYKKPEKSIFEIDHIGIKASQFSFSRLAKADPVLGVDMSSTGEVGCIGDSYYDAVLKAMLSVGYRIPKGNVMVSSGPIRDKVELLNSCRMMVAVYILVTLAMKYGISGIIGAPVTASALPAAPMKSRLLS